ncbi:MAG: chemotaxis protein CheR [Acidobacteriota bacterium]|nr:MAG: chemotaxis protein CheR [Acidobacteriota bacterium]
MRDEELVGFLQWALPRAGLRWRGFRRVRRQVGRRLSRRLQELGVADLAAYRLLLEACPDPKSDEWRRLARMCRVTISRFYRDRRVWAQLRRHLLPDIVQHAVRAGHEELLFWSAGCASGEEPYTLALAWQHDLAWRWPAIACRIVGTDVDRVVLGRAADGVYDASSLRELPRHWREASFRPEGQSWRIADSLREAVSFVEHDVERAPPLAGADLVLCRNLVFTYLHEAGQRRFLAKLSAQARAESPLVIGCHESLPPNAGFGPHPLGHPIYYRQPSTSAPRGVL